MRIALIILSILSLVFIGLISWSVLTEGSALSLQIPKQIPNDSKIADTDKINDITLETWKNQVKADEKIERLTQLVEELAKKNGTYTPDSETLTTTGSEVKPVDPVIKPSGKLLALLMPTVTPVLEKNNGIFGLYIFDTNVSYSTYRDNSIPMTFIVMNTGYETMLKNIKALGGKPYSTNETKTFPFRSFFINSEPPDSTVRLIVDIEGQSIAIEVPKAKYELLKNLLLGKGGTNIKALGITTNTPPSTAKPGGIPSTKTGGALSKSGVSLPKTAPTPSTKTGTTIRIINP